MAKKASPPLTQKYLDAKLDEFGKQFESNVKKELKGELFTIKDEVVGEIKGFREEFNTHQYSHSRINDEIQDLQIRVSKVETRITS